MAHSVVAQLTPCGGPAPPRAPPAGAALSPRAGRGCGAAAAARPGPGPARAPWPLRRARTRFVWERRERQRLPAASVGTAAAGGGGGGGGGRGGQCPPLCGAGEGGTHTRHRALCDAPSPGRRRWRPPLFELRCCRAAVTQLGLDSRWSAAVFFYYFLPSRFYIPPPRAGRDRWLSNPRARRRGQEEPHLLQRGRGWGSSRPLPRSRSWRRSFPSLPFARPCLVPRSPPAPHVTGAGSRISCSRCAGNPARSAALRWRRGCATRAPGRARRALPPARGFDPSLLGDCGELRWSSGEPLFLFAVKIRTVR